MKAIVALLSRSFGRWALTLALVNIAGSAHGQIMIIPTYDRSITNDPSAMMIENGIQAAINRVEAAISNPITVNITFQEGGGLGGSNTFIGSIPYGPAGTPGTYLNALTTKQTLSPNDVTAIASLPNQANNPVNGNASVQLTTPLLRAIGFNAPEASDSTITLNTSIMNLSRTGPQNPSNYDLQAVAGHEIDEVLGIGGSGSAMQLTSTYTGQASPTGPVGVLDLFRYSALGTRSFTMDPNAMAYFSIDGGATNEVYFNQNGWTGTSSADFSDWGNGGTGTGNQSGNSPPQLQDAFGAPGAMVDLGSNERTALDVVGYNLSPVPEPGSLALVGAAMAAAGFARRRRMTVAAPAING